MIGWLLGLDYESLGADERMWGIEGEGRAVVEGEVGRRVAMWKRPRRAVRVGPLRGLGE
jgi:hypothetical protein